jgi:two-component system chemotaxis response regulator CheY
MAVISQPHAAFGCTLSTLDVVLVEDSKPMQLILRSMFNAAKIGRLRVYDDAGSALEAMLTEPPNLLVTDWNMSPINGYQLIRSIRSAHMKSLCYVPAIVITAHATHRGIDKLVRGGAHHVVVKPFSSAQLMGRIEALLTDNRPMTIDPETGMVELTEAVRMLDSQAPRWRAVQAARDFHRSLNERGRGRMTDVEAVGGDEYRAKPERNAPQRQPSAGEELVRRIIEASAAAERAAAVKAEQRIIPPPKPQPEPAKAVPRTPSLGTGTVGGMGVRRSSNITMLD